MRQGRVVPHPFSALHSMQQLLPAASGRARILFTTNDGGAGITDQKKAALNQTLTLSFYNSIIIDRRDYGDMVDHAWYGFVNSVGNSITAIEVMEGQ